jgi:hypothetical protein
VARAEFVASVDPVVADDLGGTEAVGAGWDTSVV